MADINVNRDSKLIKVLASQVRNERLDSNVVEEANKIIEELAEDLSPANRYQIAQTIAYTVDELQQKALDFLNVIADVKNIPDGGKAAFAVRQGHVKAYIQAKGATTARSMIGGKQIIVPTKEISARPAINIVDYRAKRINIADMIREANQEMTNAKIAEVEAVLQAAIDDFSTPFYATATGVVKGSIDPIINHFRRLGPVTIAGDIAAVGQLSGIAGMAMNPGTNTDIFNQYADGMINDVNNNGFIGKYNGCNVIALQNAYRPGTTNTVLDTDWLYIIPGGMTGDMRNLKIANEGTVHTIDSQNIDDMTFEVRLDQNFGAAFVVGDLPNIGAYCIG